jgi:hypothetical protein
LGGRWDYGSSCGGFYWALDDASSDRYRCIGGRLVNARFSLWGSDLLPHRLFQINLCIPESPRRLAEQTAPERGKLKIKLGCIGRL